MTATLAVPEDLPDSSPRADRSNLPANLAEGLAGRHLAGLDGLRAVAAFLVVIYHAGLDWVPASVGVLAFFVLSGFLITWLIIGEEDATQHVSLKRFYVRRSFRIFPAFYAYLAVVFAIWVLRGSVIHVAQTVSSALYVSNYYQAIFGDPNTALSHTWSLAVEEQFYLLWPLGFILLRNNRRRFVVLSTLIPILWIYRELLVFVFHVRQSYIYEAFDTRVDHLLVGCLLAVCFRGGYLDALWRRVCASPYYVLVTIALIVLTVYGRHWYRHPDYRDIVEFVAEPVLFAILIAQLISFPRHAITRPFNWGWMRYLGKLSYSIYLYQQLVAYPIESRLHSTPLLALVGVVACTIIAAAASYYLVEQPFLRLRQRFS